MQIFSGGYLKRREEMSREKIILVIKVIAPVIAALLWLLLYFTVLWRLPFTCNLNRVKLPKNCKEIEMDVIQSHSWRVYTFLSGSSGFPTFSADCSWFCIWNHRMEKGWI